MWYFFGLLGNVWNLSLKKNPSELLVNVMKFLLKLHDEKKYNSSKGILGLELRWKYDVKLFPAKKLALDW